MKSSRNYNLLIYMQAAAGQAYATAVNLKASKTANSIVDTNLANRSI